MTPKLKPSLSLIQSISAVFITITVLVTLLSFTSLRGLAQIGQEFEDLSERALPLAMNNADLTQSILSQVKQISYAAQTKSLDDLDIYSHQIETNLKQSTHLMEQAFALSGQFDSAINEQEAKLLRSHVEKLRQDSLSVLNNQRQLIEMQSRIDTEITGFRYGLSSIGPEMNRISSFLAVDNPESSDAANRFIASASSMESTFLMLMMQNDIEKAKNEYREMRNRIAGIELAFDDFKEWHPDVIEFSSLIAPYDMVREGFKKDGVVQQILAKLALYEQQRDLVTSTGVEANNTIELLNVLAEHSHEMVQDRKSVVNHTISDIRSYQIIGSVSLVVLIVAFWISMRAWVNRGLSNVSKHLNRLTEHNFASYMTLRGPNELKDVASLINQVIVSTRNSLIVVRDNSESLNKVAQKGSRAANLSHHGINEQHNALTKMVTTVRELEESIGEISKITYDSFNDSNNAIERCSHGVGAIDENQTTLMSLQQTLDLNEKTMSELDERVGQISQMVDLIAGIADNTNLLALNAAIEAARAGEQGRGFAVVADEVRKLASDTSDQTNQIRERMQGLISAAEQSREAVVETRKEMDMAIQSSNDVKATFHAIEKAVNEIGERIGEISVATEQQETSTADFTQAITKVQEQSQQTRTQLNALVDTSEEVAQIALEQNGMLQKYRLNQV
ncbi:methyl-accepting chemotaxis protein [Vibrio sonorensis]|uniref:methyl-accepting chemotaxis protein n=1 Tax=Vibrio sonorensis TaxID=1004316 RepID=UPI0008D92BE5|nr:methyl-accepting chemotaxis protein [Vibrio sonorensis]